MNKPPPSKLALRLDRVKKPCIEYSTNSSIHGFGYLVENERSSVEKWFWAALIITSIVSCGFLISDLYEKWILTPVIVSVSARPTPVWQIPFPAITICPEDKVDTEVFDIVKMTPYFINKLRSKEHLDPEGDLL
jgi:acid-sensing ion channel, other